MLFPDVTLGIDTAVPCGLVINELVSNALKHAFPLSLFPPRAEGRKRGAVRVSLHVGQGRDLLTVQDNGVGFPAELDFRHTETLGLHLVTTLVRQLQGDIELDRSGEGATFRIRFAELERKGSNRFT